MIKPISDELSQTFKNRVAKRLRHLSKWGRRAGVSAYRLYDRDVPGVNVTVDLYQLEGAALFALMYFHEKKESDGAQLPFFKTLVAESLGLEGDHVISKTRKRMALTNQYEKLSAASNAQSIKGVVREGSLFFEVNLTDYLDTGLFLDMRLQRALIKSESAGCRVLNLFCYTGSFSVYSAAGGAVAVESVDLSKNYLDWARRNMAANGFLGSQYTYVSGDCIKLLDEWAKTRRGSFDLVILDPPTFSNSKRTVNTLDIKRDHPKLIACALKLLSLQGTLYFSTNERSFTLNTDKVKALFGEPFFVKDVTKASLDKDFISATHLPHRIFKLQCKAD